MAHYDVGLVCLNGHSVNSKSHSSPEFNTKFCRGCGEPTIDTCQKCKAPIRGYCHIEGVITMRSWKPPRHCHECGEAYPWTERRREALAAAIEELDELTETEREKLRESIPDVIQETPKTETAVARFKKAIGQAGTVGGRLLSDVLTKVAAEVVVKSMGIN